MKEELIKAIEEKRLTEFVIDKYNNMPIKTVRRLLILLAVLADDIKAEYKERLIEHITTYYRQDFE